MATISETLLDFLGNFPRNRNTLSHTSKYMDKLFRTYVNDDIIPYDFFNEKSINFAEDIANRLINDDMIPSIAVVEGIVNGGGKPELIIPKLSIGEELWEKHYFCCVNGLVKGWAYDPMMGIEPIAIKEYSEIAFSEEVVISILIPSEDIREHLNREFLNLYS